MGISVNTEAVDTIQAYGDTLTEQMLDDGRRVYTVRRFWEIRIEGYTELAYEISLTSFGLGLFDLTINLYKCGGWRISGEKSGGLFILTLEQG